MIECLLPSSYSNIPKSLMGFGGRSPTLLPVGEVPVLGQSPGHPAVDTKQWFIVPACLSRIPVYLLCASRWWLYLH